MQNELKRLGDAELEIMQALWEETEPVTSGQILERIKSKRSWALSTLMTSLGRLADKGYVLCDRTTRTNMYSALIGEDEYKICESRKLLDRLYGSSVSRFVACLYNCRSVDEQEISELRALLDRLEENCND